MLDEPADDALDITRVRTSELLLQFTVDEDGNITLADPVQLDLEPGIDEEE